MVEHDPWCGPNYKTFGLKGQRIAIVGYSHHRCETEPDTNAFTVETVRRAISHDDMPFFAKIRSYFGYEHSGDFWNSVLFFNFLPDCVGTTDRRYAYGTSEQIERGRARALQLFREYSPERALIFTTKGWHEFPPTREEAAGGSCTPLGTEFARFSFGTYGVGDHVVIAVGLRHPQYANDDLMKRAVERALALPR